VQRASGAVSEGIAGSAKIRVILPAITGGNQQPLALVCECLQGAMAQLDILRYPDPRLHTVAKPVAAVDERIRQLVDDMLETMYAADGVGLAATQVDVHERVVVIDTSQDRDTPRVLINPELVKTSERMVDGEEGCLSVPQIYDKVARHAEVTVRATNRDGEVYEFEAEGLLAVCVQHEMDHLLGKVFVEYLSPLKRDRIKTKMVKKAREEEAEAKKRNQRL
jgi:peptide deformylase